MAERVQQVFRSRDRILGVVVLDEETGERRRVTGPEAAELAAQFEKQEKQEAQDVEAARVASPAGGLDRAEAAMAGTARKFVEEHPRLTRLGAAGTEGAVVGGILGAPAGPGGMLGAAGVGAVTGVVSELTGQGLEKGLQMTGVIPDEAPQQMTMAELGGNLGADFATVLPQSQFLRQIASKNVPPGALPGKLKFLDKAAPLAAVTFNSLLTRRVVGTTAGAGLGQKLDTGQDPDMEDLITFMSMSVGAEALSRGVGRVLRGSAGILERQSPRLDMTIARTLEELSLTRQSGAPPIDAELITNALTDDLATRFLREGNKFRNADEAASAVLKWIAPSRLSDRDTAQIAGAMLQSSATAPMKKVLAKLVPRATPLAPVGSPLRMENFSGDFREVLQDLSVADIADLYDAISPRVSPQLREKLVDEFITQRLYGTAVKHSLDPTKRVLRSTDSGKASVEIGEGTGPRGYIARQALTNLLNGNAEDLPGGFDLAERQALKRILPEDQLSAITAVAAGLDDVWTAASERAGKAGSTNQLGQVVFSPRAGAFVLTGSLAHMTGSDPSTAAAMGALGSMAFEGGAVAFLGLGTILRNAKFAPGAARLMRKMSAKVARDPNDIIAQRSLANALFRLHDPSGDQTGFAGGDSF